MPTHVLLAHSYVVYIVCGVLALFFDLIISLQFRKIAVIKGWPSLKYFFYPFFFSVAGYLMVVALPDRGTTGTRSFDSSDLPEL